MFVVFMVVVFGPFGLLWGAAVGGSLVVFGLIGITIGIMLGLYLSRIRLPFNEVSSTTGFMLGPLVVILAVVAVVVWGIRHFFFS